MPKPAADVPENQIPQITDAGALELLKRERGTIFPPGSRWEYSNSGYCVLAMVVEQVSGIPFGTFLRERVFAPLKMTRTVAWTACGTTGRRLDSGRRSSASRRRG